ncbi:MAG TPA: hypothetical protein ENI27_08245 [bacterium]|nr:hypothetical protein [bacterium]
MTEIEILREQVEENQEFIDQIVRYLGGPVTLTLPRHSLGDVPRETGQYGVDSQGNALLAPYLGHRDSKLGHGVDIGEDPARWDAVPKLDEESVAEAISQTPLSGSVEYEDTPF